MMIVMYKCMHIVLIYAPDHIIEYMYNTTYIHFQLDIAAQCV